MKLTLKAYLARRHKPQVNPEGLYYISRRDRKRHPVTQELADYIVTRRARAMAFAATHTDSEVKAALLHR